MKISVLTTDANHPVFPRLEEWCDNTRREGHQVELVTLQEQLDGGDILFLTSCSEIIPQSTRELYEYSLVLHASDLPKGRGWSPHIWRVIEGKNEITVSLISADEPVDTGDIWLKKKFTLEGHELLEEINYQLFQVCLQLMTQFVTRLKSIIPKPQSNKPPTFYRLRTPADSQLDPNKTIAEQFNLLRVVDSKRYPAFFEFQGSRYLLKIEKSTHEK